MMQKMDKWEAEHVNWNAFVHLLLGFGFAWLLVMIWQGYSVISLVLGIICLVIGLAGWFYPLFRK